MRFRSTLLDAPPARSYGELPRGSDLGKTSAEAGRDGDLFDDLAGGGPDVNPELTGGAKHDVYDEMSKTDPTVKSGELFVWLPVRAAHWGISPGIDDPTGRLIRDFCNWNLGVEDEDGELDLSWDELTAQGLKMTRFGAMLEELVYSELRYWRDADGDEHLVQPLARVAPRYPRTIQKVERRSGRIVQVEQNLAGTRPIPGDFVSHLIFEREGSRWDGVSLLRPAWGAWRIKKELLISTGISWDRFASGLPVIYHPDDPGSKRKADEIGRDVRHHERAYVSIPVPPGLTRDLSTWGIELLNAAATIGDPTPILRYCSEQEAEAFLAHWSQLGTTETGARAVGEVQIDPFFLAVQALAHYLRRERRRQILTRLVQRNFGQELVDKGYVPKLTVSKIQARSLSVMANAISLLNGAGFKLTLRQDQDDVRELLGFEKLPNDLDARGIDRERLTQILQSLGLDSATFAGIVNALPPEMGVARNRDDRVPREGDPLPV